MPKFEVSNPNYAARIVRVTRFKTLEGCDNVKAAIIHGEQVIVGKDMEVNTLGVFFPLECSLVKDYLSKNNLYSTKTLNSDPEKGGFFNSHGRVTAKKFRGHRSDGYLAPMDSLRVLGINPDELKEGDEFTSIDGIKVCWKFIPPVKVEKKKSGKGITKNKAPKPDELIQDGMFRLHYDTTNINKCADQFNADPVVSISYKLHGTSAIFANLPVRRFHPMKQWLIRHNGFVTNDYTKRLDRWLKRVKVSESARNTLLTRLSRFEGRIGDEILKTTETRGEKLIQMLGFKPITHTHSNIAASRKVIKCAGESRGLSGFYDEDIWSVVNEEVKARIPKGFTVYGEIVGYTTTGSPIQGDYTYGCEKGEHKLFVYRVTQTNEDGQVFELAWPSMLLFCQKYDFTPVPEFWYGRVSEFLAKHNRVVEEGETLGDTFIEKMTELYLDKPCFMCAKPLVCEGVVIRIDGLHSSEAFKLKSYGFKEFESKQNDKGVVDIETAQAEETLE